jgi:uncharacterized protein (TIGR02996 family)
VTVDPRAALLANIIEHPADDGPRLVYADALEEYGDGAGDLARAEFIRVQCELAALRAGAAEEAKQGRHVPPAAVRNRCEELVRRERGLWSPVPNPPGHPCQWFNIPGWACCAERRELRITWTPPDYSVIEATVRRGFVSSLTLPSVAWLKHGDALLAASPITDVALADWPGIMWVSGSGPMTLHTFAGTHFTGEWFRVGDINPDTWRPAYRDPLARPKPRESCRRYVARELLAGRWGDRVTFTLPA